VGPPPPRGRLTLPALRSPVVGRFRRRRALPAFEGRSDQVAQRLLVEQWHQRRHLGMPAPDWATIGFGAYSANDEDGILLYLFDLAGTTNRILVDIGSGLPHGANSTNLLVSWGWTGVLVEGDPAHVAEARSWFEAHPQLPWPPFFVPTWVDPDTIDELFTAQGLVGDVDLLLIDIDGVDLWLWDELTVLRPRVVVVEYSHFWGPHRSVSVPRDADVRPGHRVDEQYCSASLGAFVTVGRRKGYRLVAVSGRRFNAFFVRDEVAPDLLPELSTEAAFANPSTFGSVPSWAADGLPGRWVEV
jgi:hypothetical protein